MKKFVNPYKREAHKMRRLSIGSPDAFAALRKRNMRDLVDIMKKATDEQKTLEIRLSADQSRTERKANLDAAKQAKQRLSKLDEPFLEAQKKKQSVIDGFLDKVAKWREIQGTTDLLVMQNYIPLFGKKSEIQALAANDKDAARALLLIPALKHKFELNDSDLARVNDSLTRHILGDDYSNLVEAKADHEAILSVRDSIFSDFEKADIELTRLMEGVVEFGGEGSIMNKISR